MPPNEDPDRVVGLFDDHQNYLGTWSCYRVTAKGVPAVADLTIRLVHLREFTEIRLEWVDGARDSCLVGVHFQSPSGPQGFTCGIAYRRQFIPTVPPTMEMLLASFTGVSMMFTKWIPHLFEGTFDALPLPVLRSQQRWNKTVTPRSEAALINPRTKLLTKIQYLAGDECIYAVANDQHYGPTVIPAWMARLVPPPGD